MTEGQGFVLCFFLPALPEFPKATLHFGRREKSRNPSHSFGMPQARNRAARSINGLNYRIQNPEWRSLTAPAALPLQKTSAA
jgi:hypothetical protein